MDDYLTIDEALVVLKEGIVVIDTQDNYFKLNKNKIIVKNKNARFTLAMKEFLELYKDCKFIIYDDYEVNIDSDKDQEYYGFKHK